MTEKNRNLRPSLNASYEKWLDYIKMFDKDSVPPQDLAVLLQKQEELNNDKREDEEERPNIDHPDIVEYSSKSERRKAWREYIRKLGKFATLGEWQDMLEVLGKSATQKEYDQYFKVCGLTEHAGDEETEGNQRYQYGMDEAYSEDWMDAEDKASTHKLEDDHNPFCPLRYGTVIDDDANIFTKKGGSNDRPLEDMFDDL